MSPGAGGTRGVRSTWHGDGRTWSVERVVLVDGPRLSELMIDHEVGVSARTVKVPKLDSDYFDEDAT